jgi:adenine-specific DNA-methyltransferase
MMLTNRTYVRKRHASVRTTDFVFNQLIPYIGNKRKLLDLIAQALTYTTRGDIPTFLDIFAGSGVVSRLAKTLGYRVIANDWEPYTKIINGCYISNNEPPEFSRFGGYNNALEILNTLPPREDWITEHLCPRDDEHYDIEVDRMFYMRKNGMRIDAIRHQIGEWYADGSLTESEYNCLLAPLLYQACYTSNTSGVFKGFHNGWGGQTKTALYRIAGDLRLTPAVFDDNGHDNEVLCDDAQRVAEQLQDRELDVAYLDPPYNQHPYGSNYHVLNTIALWDKPTLSKTITPGSKSAIRLDWRTARRSAYNHVEEAARAYARLVGTLSARFVLTSYSTDGFIPLEKMLEANISRGHVHLEMKGYKRYRVSSQRFSDKPMNVEFVVVLDTHRKSDVSVDELRHSVSDKEESVLHSHSEYVMQNQAQLTLFEGAKDAYVTQASTED